MPTFAAAPRRAPACLVALLAVMLAAAAALVCLGAPPARAAATALDAVQRFAVPAGTTQVVLVRSSSWSSTYASVEFFQRSRAGSPWVAALPAQAGRVGYNGMTEAALRHQGNGTTPAGIFTLPFAFGGAPDPGSGLPYTRFTTQAWWPGDPLDPRTYNTYQPRRSSSVRWRTSYAEHLADYFSGSHRQYAYAAVIGFNLPAPYSPPDTRLGSGIFFHANGAGSTAGCVSISEPAMTATLRWLRPAADPVMVIGPTSWLDDAVPTTASLRTMAFPAPYLPADSTLGFTAISRSARMQWWRLTVTNPCTGSATIATTGGQGDTPIVAHWNARLADGRTAPPGPYRMRIDAGTASWTVEASRTWTVEIYAAGARALSGCPARRISGNSRYVKPDALARLS